MCYLFLLFNLFEFFQLFHHAFRIRLNLLHMAGTERADTVRADAVWTVKGIKGRFIQLQVSHSLHFKSETPNRILLT